MMLLLLECGITDAEILAATLLHDVVEDTDTTLGDVRLLFGARVASYVREVSDDKSLDKKTRKQNQVKRIAAASVGAQTIKVADKWSNCKDLRTDPPKGWSAEDALGYATWSFTICQNVSPLLNHKLKATVDRMFVETFQLHPQRHNLETLLAHYYNQCI